MSTQHYKSNVWARHIISHLDTNIDKWIPVSPYALAFDYILLGAFFKKIIFTIQSLES